MLVQYWEGLYQCEEEVLAATGDVPSDASRGRERIQGRGRRWGYTGPDDGDELLGGEVEHPSCLVSPDARAYGGARAHTGSRTGGRVRVRRREKGRGGGEEGLSGCSFDVGDAFVRQGEVSGRWFRMG